MTEDDRLLLHAMLDGELDAPSQRTVERRFAGEPDLACAYANLRALRGAMRALPNERASEALRRRVAALAEPASPPPAIVRSAPRPRWPVQNWSLMAASLAALLVGGAGGWFGALQMAPTSIEQALVASHVRGLIADRPFDVASSDRHTVRPWFAGKLAVAPFVADLTKAGFPLEGGRVDVVDGVPEPTLVYRRGPHTISLTRVPRKGLSTASLQSHHSVGGLAVLNWRARDGDYVAVSDAAPPELDALRAAFDAAQAEGDAGLGK